MSCEKTVKTLGKTNLQVAFFCAYYVGMNLRFTCLLKDYSAAFIQPWKQWMNYLKLLYDLLNLINCTLKYKVGIGEMSPDVFLDRLKGELASFEFLG